MYVGDELVGYAHHDFVSELTLLQQGTSPPICLSVVSHGMAWHGLTNAPPSCLHILQAMACAWSWTATWSSPPGPTPPSSARGASLVDLDMTYMYVQTTT